MIYALGALVVVIASASLVLIERRRHARSRAEAARYIESVSDVLQSARKFALAARNSAGEVRAAIDTALREKFQEIDCVAIFTPDDHGGLACVYASPGSRCERYVNRADYSPADLSTAEVLPLVAQRTGRSVTEADGQVIHPGCRHAVAVPLRFDRGNTTVVYASSSTQPFADSLPAIEMLLEQAEPALLLAGAREESESRATYDSLTGLLGRWAFDARLREEMLQCQSSGRTIALLYIDADYFKTWNDTFGHHSGDLLLQRFADILSESRVAVRDFVARRGGDEFCMVLNDVDKATAIDRAVAIGSAIAFDDRSALVPAELAETELVPITASIGVALFPRDASNFDELLFRADKVMYQSKERGKGRVCFVSDDGTIGDINASAEDRRNDSTRPFSDRRLGGRGFVPAEAGGNGF